MWHKQISGYACRPLIRQVNYQHISPTIFFTSIHFFLTFNFESFLVHSHTPIILSYSREFVKSKQVILEY